MPPAGPPHSQPTTRLYITHNLPQSASTYPQSIMSLTRALFNEFRPFFRVLDDPFMASADPFAIAPRHRHRRSRQPRQEDDILSQLGLGFPEVRTPRVRVTEEDNSYIVNAEVPGIKKEELDVSIGDGGRSLTIQAESSSGTPPTPAATPAAEATPQDAPANTSASEGEPENETQSCTYFSLTQTLPRCCRSLHGLHRAFRRESSQHSGDAASTMVVLLLLADDLAPAARRRGSSQRETGPWCADSEDSQEGGSGRSKDQHRVGEISPFPYHSELYSWSF